MFNSEKSRKLRMHIADNVEGGRSLIAQGMSFGEMVRWVMKNGTDNDNKLVRELLYGPAPKFPDGHIPTPAELHEADKQIARARRTDAALDLNENERKVAVIDASDPDSVTLWPQRIPATKGFGRLETKTFMHVDSGKADSRGPITERVPDTTFKTAYDAVYQWINDRSSPAVLVLFGHVGCGKTELAQAAAMALDQRGEEVVYRRDNELNDELKGHLRTSTYSDAMHELKRCFWLVWDDIATAPRKDWGAAELDEIVDARWQGAAGGQMRTLVTTNVESKDLPPRVASRLGDTERGRQIVIRAEDFRRRPR